MTEPKCLAVLNIKGEHFACDWPAEADGSHVGFAHSSRAAQAIWTDNPSILRAAWDGAEAAGR